MFVTFAKMSKSVWFKLLTEFADFVYELETCWDSMFFCAQSINLVFVTVRSSLSLFLYEEKDSFSLLSILAYKIRAINELNCSKFVFNCRGHHGVFARLRASVCVLMQTFGPFKLSLSNTSKSQVKWSRKNVQSNGLLLSSDNRLNQYKCFRDRVIYCSINLITW